jgi:LytTr DNA-binding domain
VTVALRSLFPYAPPFPASELPRVYLYVALIGVVIGIPMSLIRQPHRAAPAAPLPSPSTTAAPPATTPFLRRIPAKLGPDLLAIATEDHYLRVTTRRGSDLILYRLSDAIAELGPAAGRQVHRSYWVARDAVAAVERHGHRTALRLVNGAEIPVSRTYLRNLREAGWLDLPPPARSLAPLTAEPPAARP